MVSSFLDGLKVQETSCGIVFHVRLQPRASRNSVMGIFDNSVKICLTTPPVDGKANAACIEFLAGIFGVAKKQVKIVSGDKSRNKIIEIAGINKNIFWERITPFLL